MSFTLTVSTVQGFTDVFFDLKNIFLPLLKCSYSPVYMHEFVEAYKF